MTKHTETEKTTNKVRSIRSSNLIAADFLSAKDKDPIKVLENLELDELMGVNALDGGACIKAIHGESPAVADALPDTLQSVASKFASGDYDTETLPIVEELIVKCFELEGLRSEKEGLITRRVSAVKEANQKAFMAVSEAREKRKKEILESAKNHGARDNDDSGAFPGQAFGAGAAR